LGLFLLVSGDFVKTGGMDRANYALASYLAARGDEVHLVAYRAAGDLLERPNVTLHRVPKVLDSYLLSSPLMHRLGRRWAARIAARGGHVLVNGGNCLWGDVNWVHHVNVLDVPRTGGVGPLRRIKNRLAHRIHVAEERAAVPMARVVVTTCERTKRDIVAHLGAAPQVVHVAHLGIDAANFRPAGPEERATIRGRMGWPAERPKVAFVGALGDRRKGFDTLFAAWSELCRDPGWDADLVVVGRGAEAATWEARAAETGLAERIRFLGFVRDLPDLFRACDAHCLPSRYEGYSLVTQEALCCGLPAFVTASAGIADRYPEELRHLLIPDPEDPCDLAGRLRRWRGRIDADKAAVGPFSQTLRDHTWDRMSEQIAGIIEDRV
jgi:glycosyltransferase involved in cell wall biosynthesis